MIDQGAPTDLLRQLAALGPLDFHRARRRTAGRGNRLWSRCRIRRWLPRRRGSPASATSWGPGPRSSNRKSTVPAIVVRIPSMGKRVMRWMPDFARRQLGPIVFLALAERGDNADAGDHHDGTAELCRCGSAPRAPPHLSKPGRTGHSSRAWISPRLISPRHGQNQDRQGFQNARRPRPACRGSAQPNASAPICTRTHVAKASRVYPLIFSTSPAPSPRQCPTEVTMTRSRAP